MIDGVDRKSDSSEQRAPSWIEPMKTMSTFVVFGLAAALASACGNSSPDRTVFPPPDASATFGSDTPATTTAPRDYTVAVGQPLTLTTTDGAVLDFTIDNLTRMAGADCTGAAYDGPPDAPFLRVDLTVRTRDVVPDDYSSLFDPFLWTVRGDDGEVIEEAGMDQNASYCLSTEEDGDDMDRFETNSIYHASIVLPQEGPTGTVILEPGFASDDRYELRY
ncbi:MULTISPECIES: hypothetical protein [Rhodococcus]|uniref:hypothetical protein n=1 Tax=Rhodococcus TaxID=1827 RepID=UPI0011AF31BD|nr:MULTISPECIES: hypothetical protein [Rhodococcus]WKW98900.1 hypothetical protein Q3O43_00735 [Rhodococcus aetherivorans]